MPRRGEEGSTGSHRSHGLLLLRARVEKAVEKRAPGRYNEHKDPVAFFGVLCQVSVRGGSLGPKRQEEKGPKERFAVPAASVARRPSLAAPVRNLPLRSGILCGTAL